MRGAWSKQPRYGLGRAPSLDHDWSHIYRRAQRLSSVGPRPCAVATACPAISHSICRARTRAARRFVQSDRARDHKGDDSGIGELGALFGCIRRRHVPRLLFNRAANRRALLRPRYHRLKNEKHGQCRREEHPHDTPHNTHRAHLTTADGCASIESIENLDQWHPKEKACIVEPLGMKPVLASEYAM